VGANVAKKRGLATQDGAARQRSKVLFAIVRERRRGSVGHRERATISGRDPGKLIVCGETVAPFKGSEFSAAVALAEEPSPTFWAASLLDMPAAFLAHRRIEGLMFSARRIVEVFGNALYVHLAPE